MPHSKQAAEAILEPYMDQLVEIFPTAWRRWEEFGKASPELRLQICPRTRASMVSNFATRAAEELFDDMSPGVILTDHPRFLLIIFDSKLHVRLKKFRSRSGQTSGIPTTQRRMFETQRPLTGFPESSNCVHGYVLKPDASYFAETAITCSDGNKLYWKIDIPLGGGSAGTVVEHRPPPTGDSPEPGISSTFEDQDQAEEGGIGD